MRARLDRWLLGLVPAIALAVAAGLSPWRFETALGPKVDAALKSGPGAGWADAVLSGRDVVLSGPAPTPEARDAAVAALRAAPGVRRVVGSAGPNAPAATRREPPAGPQATAESQPPTVAPFSWSARRSGQAVTLAGHAPSAAARERVAAAARRLDPAARVDVQVARGLPPGLDYEAATDLLLAQLARIGEGEVGLTDDVLRVSGTSADKDAGPQVAAALAAGLPAGFRLGDLSLAATRPLPYRFEARRAPGRLLIAGHLPDDAARDALRSLVRRRFFGEVVEDRLRLADGAPAGFAAGAGLGLEQLSRLAEGEVSLTETALVVSGETLYEQTAERMRADLGPAQPGAALPSGFTARADVRVRREPARRERASP